MTYSISTNRIDFLQRITVKSTLRHGQLKVTSEIIKGNHAMLKGYYSTIIKEDILTLPFPGSC